MLSITDSSHRKDEFPSQQIDIHIKVKIISICAESSAHMEIIGIQYNLIKRI